MHVPMGSGLTPSQFWGPGYYPRKICENIGVNLCNLVHFVVKNKHFKQKQSNVHQNQLVNYHLPQTLAEYLVLHLIGAQYNRKCTTQCLI